MSVRAAMRRKAKIVDKVGHEYDWGYTYECGSYYFWRGDNIVSMCNEIAICFDTGGHSWIMMKHGPPERVNAWATEARKRFRSAGFEDMARDLIVVSGKFPVEELNFLINCSGYSKVFYEKLVGPWKSTTETRNVKT